MVPGEVPQIVKQVVESLSGEILRSLDFYLATSGEKAIDRIFIAGGTANKETYVVEASPAPGLLTAVRLEALPDDSLPAKSLGRASNGNFVLSAFEVRLRTADGKTTNLPLTKAEADFDQPGWSIAKLGPAPMTKGKAKKADNTRAGWAIGGHVAENRVPRKAIFTVAPTQIPAGAKLIVVMRHEAVAQHSIGRFRLNTSSLDPKLLSLKTDAAAEAEIGRAHV